MVAAAGPPEALILNPRAAREAGLLVQANIPYVLKDETRAGALLLYGAAHSSDPAHPQFAEICRQWTEFRPTVALNEGGSPCFTGDADRSISRNGEAGLVVYLAVANRTPVVTFEPPLAAEIAALRPRFSPEQIAVFYVLRLVAQEAGRELQPRGSTRSCCPVCANWSRRD